MWSIDNNISYFIGLGGVGKVDKVYEWSEKNEGWVNVRYDNFVCMY